MVPHSRNLDSIVYTARGIPRTIDIESHIDLETDRSQASGHSFEQLRPGVFCCKLHSVMEAKQSRTGLKMDSPETSGRTYEQFRPGDMQHKMLMVLFPPQAIQHALKSLDLASHVFHSPQIWPPTKYAGHKSTNSKVKSCPQNK